jgi:predicted small secreted protein
MEGKALKRDCTIITLLALALVLTACAGKRPSGADIDWSDLARSAAVPEFGEDECGQTLVWSYELGRWQIAGGKEVVAENRTVIRVDCKPASEPEAQ